MIDQISCAEFLQKTQETPEWCFLIDVREGDEYEQGTIPGAKNFPLSELDHHIPEIEKMAQERPLVIHCQVGGRSMRACEFLDTLGIHNVTNLSGGYSEFSTM